MVHTFHEPWHTLFVRHDISRRPLHKSHVNTVVGVIGGNIVGYRGNKSTEGAEESN